MRVVYTAPSAEFSFTLSRPVQLVCAEKAPGDPPLMAEDHKTNGEELVKAWKSSGLGSLGLSPRPSPLLPA